MPEMVTFILPDGKLKKKLQILLLKPNAKKMPKVPSV